MGDYITCKHDNSRTGTLLFALFDKLDTISKDIEKQRLFNKLSTNNNDFFTIEQSILDLKFNDARDYFAVQITYFLNASRL